jgi:hypothetical protein
LTAWWKAPVLAAAATYAHLVRIVNLGIVYRVHIFAEKDAFWANAHTGTHPGAAAQTAAFHAASAHQTS